MLTRILVGLSVLFLAREAQAFDPCTAAKKVAGQWRFTTIVTEAKKPAMKGVNGFYELTIGVEDCKVTATLVKTGYTGKTFAADQRQVGSATLTVDSMPPQSENPDEALVSDETRLVLPITIRNGTSEVSLSLELLVSKKQMYGRWEYTGASFEADGLKGLLVGKSGVGKAVSLTKKRQVPCDVQCRLDGYYYESNSSQMCQQSCEDGH